MNRLFKLKKRKQLYRGFSTETMVNLYAACNKYNFRGFTIGGLKKIKNLEFVIPRLKQ